MSSRTPEPQQPLDKHSAEPDERSPLAKDEQEAQLYYERLEQTGQLVDVDDSTSVDALPAHVTHVRYPDGTVERISFSTSY